MAKYAKRILIIFLIASVGYLVAKEFSADDHRLESTGNDAISNAVEAPADGIVFYYFHGYRRCPTCNAIERYSYEAVRSNFDEELKNGTLRLETINVEIQENRHFINEFQIHSSGPVIVEYMKGKVVRFKALDQVWLLVRDKDSFQNYVTEEIKRFKE